MVSLQYVHCNVVHMVSLQHEKVFTNLVYTVSLQYVNYIVHMVSLQHEKVFINLVHIVSLQYVYRMFSLNMYNLELTPYIDFFNCKTGNFSFQNNPKYLDPSFLGIFITGNPKNFIELINIFGAILERRYLRFLAVNTVIREAKMDELFPQNRVATYNSSQNSLTFP